MNLSPDGGHISRCPVCRSLWQSNDRAEYEGFRCCATYQGHLPPEQRMPPDAPPVVYVGTLAEYLGCAA